MLTASNTHLAWFRVEYLVYVSYSVFDKEESCLLQKPVSRPTEKQLASWLKEADKATGSLELSIAGLVFMVATRCLDNKGGWRFSLN